MRECINVAFWGNNAYVKKFINKYGAAHINKKNESGATVLMFTAMQGDKDALAFLLEKGADIEAKDRWNMTALMHAASHGHKDNVMLLLKNGADTEKKCKDGRTALMFAEEDRFFKIAKLLKQWPERQRKLKERQLARELDEITKTVMGGLTKALPYKPLFKFLPPGGSS